MDQEFRNTDRQNRQYVRPLNPGVSKRGRHEAPKRIDDFMCGLELRQIRKPRDDSIIETYRMGKISVNRDNVFITGNYLQVKCWAKEVLQKCSKQSV